MGLSAKFLQVMGNITEIEIKSLTPDSYWDKIKQR